MEYIFPTRASFCVSLYVYGLSIIVQYRECIEECIDYQSKKKEMTWRYESISNAGRRSNVIDSLED